MNTITDEWAEANMELHRTHEGFGARSHRHAARVTDLILRNGYESVLDYGCGKGTLVTYLCSKLPGMSVQGWDPGHEYFSKQEPEPADLVICTDVLEHVEPDLLDNVLEHIGSLTYRAIYLEIATRPDGSKTMPDGSQPHQIIEAGCWWKERINEAFDVRELAVLENTSNFIRCIIKVNEKDHTS